MEVTDKQKVVICHIESNLNVKFRGSTLDEARDFISKHIKASYSARSSAVSYGKQAIYADRRELISSILPKSGYHFDDDNDLGRPY